MPQYTVKNDKGREVTFEWHGQGEPTDADLEEVFAAAEPERSWTDTALDAAPTIGGLAGGVAGGKTNPLGIALSGMGGAAGEAVRQIGNVARGRMDQVPSTPFAQLKQIGMEGVKQAGLEGAGRGVSGLVAGGAKMLYRGLLKPSKAVRGEFGDVAADLLKNRRLITRGGADAAETAVDASSGAAERLIRGASPTATDIPAKEIVSEFAPVVQAVRDRVRAGVVPESELAKIGERGARLVKTAGGGAGRGVGITEAQSLKKAAQDAAAGAYKQMRAGNIKQLGTDDLLDAATARGFKQGLEKRVPGLGPQNKMTQGLIGQLRALQDAVGRTGNHLPFGSVSDLAAMTAGSVIPGAGVVGKAATMAGPGSAMAIGANELSRLPMAQIVRAMQLAQLQDQ